MFKMLQKSEKFMIYKLERIFQMEGSRKCHLLTYHLLKFHRLNFIDRFLSTGNFAELQGIDTKCF